MKPHFCVLHPRKTVRLSDNHFALWIIGSIYFKFYPLESTLVSGNQQIYDEICVQWLNEWTSYVMNTCNCSIHAIMPDAVLIAVPINATEPLFWKKVQRYLAYRYLEKSATVVWKSATIEWNSEQKSSELFQTNNFSLLTFQTTLSYFSNNNRQTYLFA